MDRRAVARETLEIVKRGTYGAHGTTINIIRQHRASADDSFLFIPERAKTPAATYVKREPPDRLPVMRTTDCSTADTVPRLLREGTANPGVLNLASAKDLRGGSPDGAMAQEESIAASSGPCQTLTRHPRYYQNDRSCPSMIYTNRVIYPPEVMLFRDDRFELLEELVTVSILTLSTVNMGRVMQKGEDIHREETAMYEWMKLALALSVQMDHRHLILGAYRCGVSRDDSHKTACWWKELFIEYFAGTFDSVVFVVVDRPKKGECLRAFEDISGVDGPGRLYRTH